MTFIRLVEFLSGWLIKSVADILASHRTDNETRMKEQSEMASQSLVLTILRFSKVLGMNKKKKER